MSPGFQGTVARYLITGSAADSTQPGPLAGAAEPALTVRSLYTTRLLAMLQLYMVLQSDLPDERCCW